MSKELSIDLSLVDSDRASGYNWPYYLMLPRELARGTPRLMVIPNNTGHPSDDFDTHQDSARQRIRERARQFPGFALLMPVFPRLSRHGHIYTHALDRDTMLISSDFDLTLVRIDLQLLAMVDHAQMSFNLQIHETRFLMFGFSAAGQFVNRFTMLHPERVMLAIAGGCGGHMVPVPKLESDSLPYPIGTADYEVISGRSFNPEAYRRIPQLFMVGENDNNDPVAYDNGYSEADRKLVYRHFSEKGEIVERFRAVEQMFREFGAAADFRVYPGVKHKLSDEMVSDCRRFIERHIQSVR